MQLSYMNARDSVVFIWRENLILILQKEVCTKCYRSIDDKIPLCGLDSQHNRCRLQSHEGINEIYTLERSRNTQSLVRDLGGKCANPFPPVSNA